MEFLKFTLVTLVVFSLFIISVSCMSDSKTATAHITAEGVFNMGRKYNKPVLRLLGKILQDIECRMCSDWTEWSACELFGGPFGMKKRTRFCGGAGCTLAGGPRNETDASVCQEFCPSHYEMTKGFCLKFYNTTAKTQAAAETECKGDGGHLFNINSPGKWAAFVSLMEARKYGSPVYIDGRRQNSKAPWTFSYETDVSGYTQWGVGEPDNGVNDLCLFARKSTVSANDGIWDVSCTPNYLYMCEIVPVF